MIGPNTTCPIKIFFKVDGTSVFGIILDRRLNHLCCDGPKINNPYIAIRAVLIKSYDAGKEGNVMNWEVTSAAAKISDDVTLLVAMGCDSSMRRYHPMKPGLREGEEENAAAGGDGGREAR